ncbi:MAG: tetratricopeptide repeat protein [Deltaproteobacteria bacterium]|nr:tetratricopeptide repeat protein [Deltaproteobacteria bacterium]
MKRHTQKKIDSSGLAGKIRRPLLYEGLMVLFFAVLVFLIYSGSLEGPFLFDDEANIETNPNIRLNMFSREGLKNAGFGSLISTRPVANISFALNYFFHQFNVMGYHIVNVVIHILNGILLYFFIKATLNILLRKNNSPVNSESTNPPLIAFFASLIWLVHPIQTQSVAYIVQRMNSMAAMFYLLSLLLYIKARQTEGKGKKGVLFTGVTLSGILAIGSKEIAATLPFFILLYEFYFFQGLDTSWLRRRIFLFIGIFFLLVSIVFIFMGAHPIERISSGYGWRDFTMAQRVLTEFRVVIFYISLLMFPHPSRLNLEHDFNISNSFTDPVTTVLAMFMIIILAGAAVYKAKKNRLLSFAIIWFLGNLVIESSVIGLEIIFEHRTYLPSMLASLLAVTLIFRYLRQRWLRVGILLVIVMIISFWTHERNRVWADSIVLWTDCVKKSPEKARPRSNLGRALAENGRPDEGIRQLKEALRLRPGYAVAHNNLGTALEKQGRLDEAISHYSEAVRIIPRFPNAHYNLGVALHRKRKINEAIEHYEETLRLNPGHALAHNNLGVALESRGKLKEAETHYNAALRIQPDYPDARRNLESLKRRMDRVQVPE